MNKKVEVVERERERERESYSLKENKKINNVGVACYATQDLSGITLISLIITIIVMLILTGVTLSIAFGENGIFSQSKLAVQKYENARLKEEQELQNASNLISNLGVASNRDEQVLINKSDLDSMQQEIATLKSQMSLVQAFQTSATNDIIALQNASELNVTEITYTTPSVDDVWTKVADFPQGYNSNNSSIISATFYYSEDMQNVVVPVHFYSSSTSIHHNVRLQIKDTGIYCYISGGQYKSKSGKMILLKINE